MIPNIRPLIVSAAVFLVAFFVSASLHAEEAATGTIETPAVVYQDGAAVGNVTVGQVVKILGMNEDTTEVLISFQTADGKTVTGLVPASALVATSKVPATTPEPAPEK
jgi:hypothetical protein